MQWNDNFNLYSAPTLNYPPSPPSPIKPSESPPHVPAALISELNGANPFFLYNCTRPCFAHLLKPDPPLPTTATNALLLAAHLSLWLVMRRPLLDGVKSIVIIVVTAAMMEPPHQKTHKHWCLPTADRRHLISVDTCFPEIAPDWPPE